MTTMCSAAGIEAAPRGVQCRYLSERELAVYSGIAVRTLQRWRLLNQGPPYKKFRGAVRYDLAAFDEWVVNQPGGGDQ